MSKDRSSIRSKFLWTTGIYVASLSVRFLTSVFLSRLLGPEILGIMVIAHAFRIGAELLTDLGLEQNVVHSPHGSDPRFLNTAWTVQIFRGTSISAGCVALSPFLAVLYGLPVEIFVAISAAPLLNSLASTSIFTLSKNLDVKTRNLFEFIVEAFGLSVNVALALAMPTVWAPILGVLLTLAARSTLSYLLPHPKHRLVVDWTHFWAIFHFGKWIMASSLANYAALYMDRLFLGRAVDMAVLGTYGLARTIAELPPILAARLGYLIVFPVVAAEKDGTATAAQTDLTSTRTYFLLIMAAGIGTVMAWSDWAVLLLYGSRFEQAGWMLFLLLIGSWVGVLSSLNSSALMGYSGPHVVSSANVIRVTVTAIALPSGFAAYGLPGAILALPAGEFVRYLVLWAFLRRLGKSFVLDDAFASLSLLTILAAWIVIRLWLGLGVSWSLAS